MTTHVLLSSIFLTGVWLAPHIASADTAADAASKRAPLAGAAKSSTYDSAKAGPSRASSGAHNGTLHTSKTALGLRIDYAFDTPATGSTTEVRIKVEGNEAGRPLSIEVVPGTGLKMARGMPGNIAVQSVPSAEHVMAITPTADGLHYIHIFLRSGTVTEALAIAVSTGKAQGLAKPVATQTMPDGRRVKSIPAQQ
jgi:hypothetical protein